MRITGELEKFMKDKRIATDAEHLLRGGKEEGASPNLRVRPVSRKIDNRRSIQHD